MELAICENIEEDIELAMDMIEKYRKLRQQLIHVEVYSGADQLLEEIDKRGMIFDIIIFDISQDGISGIEAGRQIRRKGFKGQIIIENSSIDYGLESFEIDAVHYLVKPVSFCDFELALDRCVRRQSWNRDIGDQVLQVKSDRKILTVRQGDIAYIEVQGKLSVIHTKGKDYMTWTPLREIYGQLQAEQFLRLQRSYIVNMEEIEVIEAGICKLKTGKEITLSRSIRKEIKEKYNGYLFRKAELTIH